MNIYLNPVSVEGSVLLLTALIGFQLGYVVGVRLERFRSKWW